MVRMILVAVALALCPSGAWGQFVLPGPDRVEGEGPFERLIIRGAIVIDGTGAPPRGPVDIVVEGNRIARIVGVGVPGRPIAQDGRPQGATREIDAEGQYVMPGFVDLHLHTGDPTK
ncbi:MAG: amidohydrolase, partial [Gemmatimonadota bacterium]|nr:amidohydrolase [Gemmatimonadota bacterium]